MTAPNQPFSGIYTEGIVQYKIEGLYNLISGGTQFSVAPDFDVLTVTFNLIDTESNKRVYKYQSFVYIFIKDDQYVIGEVLDQQPKPFPGEFFVTLKDIVVAAFKKASEVH